MHEHEHYDVVQIQLKLIMLMKLPRKLNTNYWNTCIIGHIYQERRANLYISLVYTSYFLFNQIYESYEVEEA